MRNSNKKGFTLVELVVVIAIIGVLAAILVPSLMGYVKKSRLKTANGNAKTAYNAVAEIDADCETQGFPINWASFTVAEFDCKTSATAKPTSALDGTNTSAWMEYEVGKALVTNGNEAGRVYVGNFQPVSGTDAAFVQWRKTSTDDIWGQYPEAVKNVDALDGKTFGTKI